MPSAQGGLIRSSESSRSNPRDLRSKSQSGFVLSDVSATAKRLPADSRDDRTECDPSHPLRNPIPALPARFEAKNAAPGGDFSPGGLMGERQRRYPW